MLHLINRYIVLPLVGIGVILVEFACSILSKSKFGEFLMTKYPQVTIIGLYIILGKVAEETDVIEVLQSLFSL